jgi:hypothetical protein
MKDGKRANSEDSKIGDKIEYKCAEEALADTEDTQGLPR